MERLLAALMVLSMVAVTLPATADGPGSIETLRNPSVEGPHGDGVRTLTGWNLASDTGAQGNNDGETTSEDARTGLQSINLAPGGAVGFPGDSRLGRLRMMTHVPHGIGAFAPGTPATDPVFGFATFAAVPFAAVEEITVHYKVPNAIPGNRDVGLQVFLYLHEDGPVVTHGFGLQEGYPDAYLCPIASDQLALTQTDGWATASWDRSSTFRMTGGVCSDTTATGSLGDLQASNQDARVLYLYVQTVADSDQPWPDQTPVLVDDLSVSAELPLVTTP